MPVQCILMKLREAISSAVISEEEAVKIKSYLKQVGDDRQDLNMHMEDLQGSIRDLLAEKESLQKNLHVLRTNLQEKSLILEEVKLRHESAEMVISRGEAERDRLVHELDEKKAELRESLASLEAAQQLQEEVKEQTEELEEEKRTLMTQMAGLRHRIEQFEEDTQRLHSDAEGLRENLHKEQAKREDWEKKARAVFMSHEHIQEQHNKQVTNLSQELDAAKESLVQLQKSHDESEASKAKMQEDHAQELSELQDQIQRLHEEGLQSTSASGQPGGAQELNHIMERAMVKGLKVEAPPSPAAYADYGPVAVEDAPPDGQMRENDSRVMEWMENAAAEEQPSLPPSPSPAPLYSPIVKPDGDSGYDIERARALLTGPTDVSERPRPPPRERRGSWPQDMSTLISDQMFGAAQEIVELNGASHEIVLQKDEMRKELEEARQLATEASTKLEKKDAEMSDLTGQFLQVYQIASNLANESDTAKEELREAHALVEGLRAQIEERDARIAALEGGSNSRLLANRLEMDAQLEGYTDGDYVMATPRSTVSLGGRPRSALPRPPSRSSAITPTPRMHVPDITTSHMPPLRLDTPSPRSGSQIPRAPGSESTNSRPTPRHNESYEVHPNLPNAHETDVQPKEATSPAPKLEYMRSKTSIKRIPRKK